MSALTVNQECGHQVQVLHDAVGNPAFAVLPWETYTSLSTGKQPKPPGIPADVVDFALDHQCSAARAWREYLQLTQAQVAGAMGITQGAYAQLERKTSIRPASRQKIAAALGLVESQFDF